MPSIWSRLRALIARMFGRRLSAAEWIAFDEARGRELSRAYNRRE